MTATATIQKAAKAISNPYQQDAQDRLRFARAVRKRREELDLTREAVYSAAAVSNQQYSNIERGHNWPSMPVFKRLCRVLKVGPVPLVG
jgi:DNA-binding XRE family transcriptional regulator